MGAWPGPSKARPPLTWMREERAHTSESAHKHNRKLKLIETDRESGKWGSKERMFGFSSLFIQKGPIGEAHIPEKNHTGCLIPHTLAFSDPKDPHWRKRRCTVAITLHTNILYMRLQIAPWEKHGGEIYSRYSQYSNYTENICDVILKC